jgi:hypothetical protein
MSYIYDSFPTTMDATAFVLAVVSSTGEDATIYTNPQDAQRVDPTIVELKGIVVHVTREYGDPSEEDLERLCKRHGGRYVGT